MKRTTMLPNGEVPITSITKGSPPISEPPSSVFMVPPDHIDMKPNIVFRRSKYYSEPFRITNTCPSEYLIIFNHPKVFVPIPPAPP